MQRLQQWVNYLKPVNFENFFEAAKTGDIEIVRRYIQTPLPVSLQDDETGDTALITAVRYGQHAVAREIIAAEPMAIQKNYQGHTALMIAARQGCNDCVSLLAKTNRPHWQTADQQDNMGRSPLMHAILNHHTQTALRLLEPDAESTINRVDNLGDSVLMMAMRHNLIPVVQKLFEMKADKSVKNLSGETAKSIAVKNESLRAIYPFSSEDFLEAAATGNFAIVRQYVYNHEKDIAKLNVRVEHTGNTALILAAEKSHIGIVRFLLRTSIDKNANPDYGTALFQAVLHGHTKVVKILLEENDLDINAKNEIYKNSALYYAAVWGQVTMVKALLKIPSISLDDAAYALKAAMQNNRYKCFKAILALPEIHTRFALVNQNGQPKPLFIEAANKKDPRFYRDLLANPMLDVNVKDSHGENALMNLCMNKDIERINELLARRDLDINAATQSGKTALMQAKSEEKIVARLVEAKADINRVTRSGNSALMLALRRNKYHYNECLLKDAEQLLDLGADTTITNETTQSALSLCNPLKRIYGSENETLNTFFNKLQKTHDRQTKATEERLAVPPSQPSPKI